MDLAEWKAKTMTELIHLTKKYKDSAFQLKELIHHVWRARVHSLYALIYKFYNLSDEIPELKNLIPSPKEINEIVKNCKKRKHYTDRKPLEKAKKEVETALNLTIK